MNIRGDAKAPERSAAWAETISGLAEQHRDRRAAYVESRWPLAHDCSAPRPSSPRLPGSEIVAVRYAFCCRALA